MKRHAKALSKQLEGLGYVWASTNSKSQMLFEHPNGHHLLVSAAVDEHAARQVLRRAQDACGVQCPVNKRNVEAVKQRQCADRERQRAEVEAHRARIDKLLEQRDRMLCGHAAGMTDRDLRAIEQTIEQADRDLQAMVRLMTAVPAGADHAGTARPARHRAGAR